MVVERDSSEFARLAQLGDILGLSQFDVATVRSLIAWDTIDIKVPSMHALFNCW